MRLVLAEDAKLLHEIEAREKAIQATKAGSTSRMKIEQLSIHGN